MATNQKKDQSKERKQNAASRKETEPNNPIASNSSTKDTTSTDRNANKGGYNSGKQSPGNAANQPQAGSKISSDELMRDEEENETTVEEYAGERTDSELRNPRRDNGSREEHGDKGNL